MPIFDDSGDSEFAFEVGREYYVNKRGGSRRFQCPSSLSSHTPLA